MESLQPILYALGAEIDRQTILGQDTEALNDIYRQLLDLASNGIPS